MSLFASQLKDLGMTSVESKLPGGQSNSGGIHPIPMLFVTSTVLRPGTANSWAHANMFMLSMKTFFIDPRCDRKVFTSKATEQLRVIRWVSLQPYG